jgi:FkbM family methyltransferase
MTSRLERLHDYRSKLGILCGLRWFALHALNSRGRIHGTVSLRPATLHHPIHLRMQTSSDPDVFSQIFLRREYAFIEELGALDTVVDLGANIGLASAVFLSQWPHARVLALEPDPASFALLCQNLTPYADRVQCVQGAAWASSGELELSHSFGDGREWATAVQESRGGAERVRAFSMPELLARVPGGRIDLLKIDIEGSERALFSSDTSWLECVRHLCIELHGIECERAFRSGMRSFAWHEARHGEYTVCRDLRRVRPGCR